MRERERLPARRDSELINFEHEGRKWKACISRFFDGRVGEIFIDGSKDSPLLALAQETAIVASIALQAGCPLATLQHALAGRSAGPIAAALALIERATP